MWSRVSCGSSRRRGRDISRRRRRRHVVSGRGRGDKTGRRVRCSVVVFRVSGVAIADNLIPSQADQPVHVRLTIFTTSNFNEPSGSFFLIFARLSSLFRFGRATRLLPLAFTHFVSSDWCFLCEIHVFDYKHRCVT